MSNKTKLKAAIISDNVDYQDYDRMYRFNPDGNLNRHRYGLTMLLQLKQILNENSFYTLDLQISIKSTGMLRSKTLVNMFMIN